MTPRAWLLFAAVSVVWGVPYFFITVAVDADVPPGFVAWSRVALGAAMLVPIALRRGALRGLRDRRGAIAAYAACEVIVPFTLISVGERAGWSRPYRRGRLVGSGACLLSADPATPLGARVSAARRAAPCRIRAF